MPSDVAVPGFLTFCAACYFLLGGRQLAGSRESGSLPVSATFFVIGTWILGGAIELTAGSPAAMTLGRSGQFVGAALLPVMLLLCFRHYIGSRVAPGIVLLLLAIPVASIVTAATNPLHELMWSTTGAARYPVAWGPWFRYVHAPYSYALLGVGLVALAMQSAAVTPAHRRGIFLLVGSTLTPLIAMLAWDFGFAPGEVPTVPMVFSLLLPVYAWLFFGDRLTETAPLAYETVFQHMQDPVVVLDDQRRIIGLNHGAEVLLNMHERQAFRVSVESAFGPDAQEVFQALETGMPQKMLTRSGRFLHLRVSPLSSGKPAARHGCVLMFRDVSDVEKAQKEVRSSEKLLRTLIDHSANGIVRLRRVVDDKGQKTLRCVFANAAAGRYLGVEPDDLRGLTAAELVRQAGRSGDGKPQPSLGALLQAAEAGASVEVEFAFDDGVGKRWLRVIGEPVADDYAATFVDITERKVKEVQMESMAWSDPLTGVLNRRGFERSASQQMLGSDHDATGALLFIDLNDFKRINDNHGHEVGDQLLVVTAERLRKGLRPGDIIGRLGGDEFVALVPDVKEPLAERLAVRVADLLEAPYQVGDLTLECSASIGLALYPAHASTLTGMLRAADQAMYRAKARSRGVPAGQSRLLEKAG